MTTIKDVAARAGVCIATVSKYMNGGNVLPEYAQRISEAVAALHYVPNISAQRLKISKTMRKVSSRIIGLVVPTLQLAFFADSASILEGLLRREGYGLIVSSYEGHAEFALKDIQMMINQNVDGLIIISENLSAQMLEAVPEICEHRLPVVLYNRKVHHFEGDCIYTNDKEATFQAIESLISLGHRQIGIIHSMANPPLDARLEGYKQALRVYDIPQNPEYMRVGKMDLISGYYNCLHLLALKKPPTAILCISYEITMGAVTALYEKGVQIPEDISLIGYDNIQLKQVVKPPLTIVVQPIEEYAHSAVQLLFRRMKGDYEDYPACIRINSWIVPGESVAPPRQSESLPLTK